jgi:putative ABC transport system permease protein
VLKTTFRNLKARKAYALINVLGLSMGIAVCLVILLVIRFETSFDNFHEHRDHIYRVVSVFKMPEGLDYESGVPFPTAQTLRHDYPELKKVSTILSLGGSGQINIPEERDNAAGGKMFREESGVFYAEPEFFGMFDFGWLAGDRKDALKEPNTVLLTRSVAEKYFGSWQSAMGRLIRLDNSFLFKVTGILDDVPANTDFPLKLVISYSTLKGIGFADFFSNWTATFAQHYCFVELPDNLTESQFDQDLVKLTQKYKPVDYRNEGMTLVPLKDMHFDTRYKLFNNHPFSRSLILALNLIGFFVLVIACVNFINLATAQAINRSKEVGIRKVLGSTRTRLLWQFLTEAALLTVVATGAAVAICEWTLPFFNRLLQMQIDPAFIRNPQIIGILLLLIAGTTLLAGFYPAFIISGFNPITALNSRLSVNRRGAFSLRRLLVVLQFTISQALIICVLIIIAQMAYFRSAYLGFEKDAMLITHIPGDKISNAKIESLRAQLHQIPGVDKVSFSYASPVDNNDWNSDISYNNVKKRDFGVTLKWADADYFSTYRLQLLAGHFYGPGDTVRDLVVNQTFLKKLGIRNPEAALGARVDISSGPSGHIVGVVRDFNVASLHDALSPVIMGTWKSTFQTVNIKMAPGKANAVLPALEKLWKTEFPDQLYEYHFLDESIAAYYRQEDQVSVLYKLFAGIAIGISCLGLYSLASFMAVQRSREVGIRKTLGATVSQIIYLFSREFTLLILIAFCLSAPIAWYFMHRWLENYAFHIHPGLSIFLYALSISLIIAGLSVGYKAFRAARVSPVKSLKGD